MNNEKQQTISKNKIKNPENSEEILLAQALPLCPVEAIQLLLKQWLKKEGVCQKKVLEKVQVLFGVVKTSLQSNNHSIFKC